MQEHVSTSVHFSMSDPEEHAPLLGPSDSPPNQARRRLGIACLLMVFYLQCLAATSYRSMDTFFHTKDILADHNSKLIEAAGICKSDKLIC
jgi:hypothetical protein